MIITVPVGAKRLRLHYDHDAHPGKGDPDAWAFHALQAAYAEHGVTPTVGQGVNAVHSVADRIRELTAANERAAIKAPRGLSKKRRRVLARAERLASIRL
ncbi:hypothetical protein [Microbacterium sp. USTB-Y]|uniref:hypothetical protein n=1 Tax=Microbacterium sp. USTB-Y TaxID=2823692 RepID=UPI00203BA3A6|nr:hypothetical protein [Microbacterium sp. USTB-Y]